MDFISISYGPFLGLLLLSVGSVIVVLVKYYLASLRPRNFPPGPPTIPFIGNISQVPKVKGFLKYEFFLPTVEYM
jgi:hypothetical protein